MIVSKEKLTLVRNIDYIHLLQSTESLIHSLSIFVYKTIKLYKMLIVIQKLKNKVTAPS